MTGKEKKNSVAKATGAIQIASIEITFQYLDISI